MDVDVDEIRDEYGLYNLDEINSLNLFVTIKNDPNKANQYLFSINSYSSLVELYNFNDENNTNYIWNFNDFFNLEEDSYIFPYTYSLLEFNRESTYFLVIIPKIDIDEYMLNTSFIKKFRFKSFDKEAYEEITSLSYNEYLYNFIINAFYMDDYRTLVVLTYAELEGNSPVNGEYFSRRLTNYYIYNII